MYLFALVQINRFIFDLEIRENFREQILVLVLSAEQNLKNEILFFDKIENGTSNVLVLDEKTFNPDKLRWIKDWVSSRAAPEPMRRLKRPLSETHKSLWKQNVKDERGKSKEDPKMPKKTSNKYFFLF